MVTGSCLCGRFAFEVEGPFEFMCNCHCSYCRKSHGAAFATFVVAKASGLRWLAGEGEQAHYESSPGVKRAFCPDCGSKVPGAPHGAQIGIPAGLLDDDPGLRPQVHFYVGSKAPWFEIGDSVPQTETLPPEYPDPGLPTPPRPEEAGENTIAGSCLCGAVAWEAEGAPTRMGHCHCSRCRKVRGAGFSTQVFFAPGAFRWLRGAEEVKDFQLPGARFFGNSFCRHCGGPVARALPGAPVVLVPAGTLDDDPGSRPAGHIYVGSKAPWYEITDALPQYRELAG